VKNFVISLLSSNEIWFAVVEKKAVDSVALFFFLSHSAGTSEAW
jgi:hypothetical protein